MTDTDGLAVWLRVTLDRVEQQAKAVMWSPESRWKTNQPLSIRQDDRMEILQAKALRDQWRANGSPPCAHEETTKERHELGAQTGDLVCVSCGATWWHTEAKPGPGAADDY